MAYVAISGDFIARVERKINGMKRAELNTIGGQPEVTCSGHEPFVTKAMWGEHAHFKDVIPSNWCSSGDRMDIKFHIPDQYRDANKTEPVMYGSSIKFTNDNIKRPPRFNNYENLEVSNTEPVLSELVQWVSKQHEINERWNGVERKIKEFLRSCKSANEAIKLWPDIKMYFDNYDIERLENKPGRTETKSAAAEVLAGIDTSEVMSAAVIARLSGAQV